MFKVSGDTPPPDAFGCTGSMKQYKLAYIQLVVASTHC